MKLKSELSYRKITIKKDFMPNQGKKDFHYIISKQDEIKKIKHGIRGVFQTRASTVNFIKFMSKSPKEIYIFEDWTQYFIRENPSYYEIIIPDFCMENNVFYIVYERNKHETEK